MKTNNRNSVAPSSLVETTKNTPYSGPALFTLTDEKDRERRIAAIVEVAITHQRVGVLQRPLRVAPGVSLVFVLAGNHFPSSAAAAQAWEPERNKNVRLNKAMHLRLHIWRQKVHGKNYMVLQTQSTIPTSPETPVTLWNVAPAERTPGSSASLFALSPAGQSPAGRSPAGRSPAGRSPAWSNGLSSPSPRPLSSSPPQPPSSSSRQLSPSFLRPRPFLPWSTLAGDTSCSQAIMREPVGPFTQPIQGPVIPQFGTSFAAANRFSGLQGSAGLGSVAAISRVSISEELQFCPKTPVSQARSLRPSPPRPSKRKRESPDR
ncbi:hypothetical protein D9757_012158 [Collybiopsis confluens]|uniref:Uncharacterized protein n=1 Tax=Collybiopsis confluens TaxID=2823264 RepID=A0A8H5G7S6_9AGAR|nr:hypothetical protein D9757_012158 [Collybiopsis confluens]